MSETEKLRKIIERLETEITELKLKVEYQEKITESISKLLTTMTLKKD